MTDVHRPGGKAPAALAADLAAARRTRLSVAVLRRAVAAAGFGGSEVLAAHTPEGVPATTHAYIDGWNPSLSYTVFAVRYKVFERSLKKTSEL